MFAIDSLSLSTCLAESPKLAILLILFAPGVNGILVCAELYDIALCGRACIVAFDELEDTLRCSCSRPWLPAAWPLFFLACC